ncbi:MAG: hypothetical protein ABW067_00485, partial [Rhizobacter sp.]
VPPPPAPVPPPPAPVPAPPAPVPPPPAPVPAPPAPVNAPAPLSPVAPLRSSPVPAGSVDLRGGSPSGPPPGRATPDVASPPPAGTPPALKLDLAPSMRGSGLPANPGSRGALNLMPPPPERKSKLAEDMQKAGKGDCRTAHADKGLLGAIPIANAALGNDSDCKW